MHLLPHHRQVERPVKVPTLTGFPSCIQFSSHGKIYTISLGTLRSRRPWFFVFCFFCMTSHISCTLEMRPFFEPLSMLFHPQPSPFFLNLTSSLHTHTYTHTYSCYFISFLLSNTIFTWPQQRSYQCSCHSGNTSEPLEGSQTQRSCRCLGRPA